jgi:hypothetical protein
MSASTVEVFSNQQQTMLHDVVSSTACYEVIRSRVAIPMMTAASRSGYADKGCSTATLLQQHRGVGMRMIDIMADEGR